MTQHTKWKQDFFTQVEPISMTDPLASVLGATEDGGVIEYRFTDCVKVAGHACVSVASAYMITKAALKALYGDDIPERGGVEVRFAGGREDGANGPIGQVISYLTGAAVETGFHGLGGRWSRSNLFTYDDQMESPQGKIAAMFRRKDTGKAVIVTSNPSMIPMTAEEQEGAQFMPNVVQGTANDEEREAFYKFWQGRNRTLLLNNPEGVIEVQEV